MLNAAAYNLNGIKKYNTLASKYGGALAIKYDKVKYADRHKKAIIKIQRHLANKVIFDVVKTENAMDDRVVDVTLRPQRVGSDIMRTTLIRSVLEQAFNKVIKSLPENSNFNFYSELSFIRGENAPREPLISSSYKSTAASVRSWVLHVENQFIQAFQSDQTISLKDLNIQFHFILQPSGAGLGTDSRDVDSILNKDSVNRIINNDNNCFWYALLVAMNSKSRALKDNRNTKLREKEARKLCAMCKLQWDVPVSLLHIPLVEETLKCNIYVLDLNNPHILGSKVNVWETMLYKSITRTNANKYWLLMDDNHYHTINNIRGYLATRHFCTNCFSCFSHTTAYENHTCNICKDKRRPRRICKNHSTNKDLAHYLKGSYCKGSRAELLAKLKGVEDEALREDTTYKHNHPKYITFDFETDTSTVHRAPRNDDVDDMGEYLHIPNHVEVDILQIDDERTHEYKKCKTGQMSFTGYGCEDKFCEWLFTKDNTNSTV